MKSVAATKVNRIDVPGKWLLFRRGNDAEVVTIGRVTRGHAYEVGSDRPWQADRSDCGGGYLLEPAEAPAEEKPELVPWPTCSGEWRLYRKGGGSMQCHMQLLDGVLVDFYGNGRTSRELSHNVIGWQLIQAYEEPESEKPTRGKTPLADAMRILSDMDSVCGNIMQRFWDNSAPHTVQSGRELLNASHEMEQDFDRAVHAVRKRVAANFVDALLCPEKEAQTVAEEEPAEEDKPTEKAEIPPKPKLVLAKHQNIRDPEWGTIDDEGEFKTSDSVWYAGSFEIIETDEPDGYLFSREYLESRLKCVEDTLREIKKTCEGICQ